MLLHEARRYVCSDHRGSARTHTEPLWLGPFPSGGSFIQVSAQILGQSEFKRSMLKKHSVPHLHKAVKAIKSPTPQMHRAVDARCVGEGNETAALLHSLETSVFFSIQGHNLSNFFNQQIDRSFYQTYILKNVRFFRT